jgi:hypothetical protein
LKVISFNCLAWDHCNSPQQLAAQQPLLACQLDSPETCLLLSIRRGKENNSKRAGANSSGNGKLAMTSQKASCGCLAVLYIHVSIKRLNTKKSTQPSNSAGDNISVTSANVPEPEPEPELELELELEPNAVSSEKRAH